MISIIKNTFLVVFCSVNLIGFTQCPVASGDATVSCGATTPLIAPPSPPIFIQTSTACPPLSTAGTNAFPTTCDDCVTGQLPIGFPFNYFGNTYTTAVISSNGILGFGPFTFTGYTPISIPAGGNPNNYIAGIMADIDIRYGGTINYQTIGVTPNRRFVVSYNNVVPFNLGSGAGTGTASFQIVLHENGTFQIIISQLSANWNASTSGANATSGCENIDGTIAIPIPGRNATDWPGIVPGAQDCNTFTPSTCTFVRWMQGATQISTTATHNVTLNTTTTYTAQWNCNGNTCTDNVVITIGGSTLVAGTPTNSTNCITPNGTIPFTYGNGTYPLTYNFNGSPVSTTVTSAANAFTLASLAPGTYTNFTIGTGVCAVTNPGPFVITAPPIPTTTGATICVGSPVTVSSSTCGVAGITTAQGATFNSGALTAADPTWVRACGGTTCFDCGTTVYYDVYPFTVSTAGSYTFTGCFPAIDGYGFIYQNAFNPASNCGVPGNFVVGNDDSAPLCGADPMMTGTLAPGVQYYLISTSFSTGATDTYSWNFTGPGGATISTGTGSNQEWYTAPTGGTSIGNTATFNPVGVAGSGLPNTNTPGTYTYYAACSAYPTCRTAASVVISAGSTPATSISGAGTICSGQSATLSVVGGSLALGANWEWFTGSCGGTLVGTGASIVVTPATTTTYFVRASTGTSCVASACISATVTLPTIGTNLANNAESATCLVNQSTYVHFYHSSGRLICSINSNGQNLGNVTATAYTGTPVDMPACAAPASYMTTAMGRRWVITPQFQPGAGVEVMLHFDNAEYTALATQANANISPWDNLTGIADLRLSKYSGPANVDNNALNNCPLAGGNGGTTIHNQAANGNTTTIIPGFSAASRYSRHTIPSFSEFWLHGASTLSPLPVELTAFKANCVNDGKTKISWKVQHEINCQNYIVEKSRDFTTWQTVSSTECIGVGQNEFEYSTLDLENLVGTVYYRLKQIDNNGEEKSYDPISLTCINETWSVSTYPNPVQNELFVTIASNDNVGDGTIEILDLTGKVISTQTTKILEGSSLLPISVSSYSNGTYILSVSSEKGNKTQIKFVIQH